MLLVHGGPIYSSCTLVSDDVSSGDRFRARSYPIITITFFKKKLRDGLKTLSGFVIKSK